MILERALFRVSLVPTGNTPGRFSNETSLQTISDLYADYEWGVGGLSSQSSSSATTTHSSSNVHKNQRSQFLSSKTSALSGSTVPEIRDTTHMTLYSKKSIVTVYCTPL